MKKIILIFLLLTSVILPVFPEEMIISDIKVQGLKRVDPGLVFDNIPFEVDTPINEANFSDAIQLLYATGQFKNIGIDLEGSVVVINVNEKPVVSTITFRGADVLQPDKIKEGMLQMNFGEGLLFNESNLKKVSNEISKQYLNLGLYSATVEAKITPQERNRVAIDFFINEGPTARIKEVKIIGITKFEEDDLLGRLDLKPTSFLSWWNKDDRYSRQILTGDLEKIRSFFMDRGYLDFNIENTTVSISETKKNVYISIVIDEGNKYNFGEIKISGKYYPLKEEAVFQNNIKTIKGEVFSRKLLNQSSESINQVLGNYGYAFSNVNPIPDVDKNNLTVGFNYFIEPGKKVYVRRISFIGNEVTKDKVLRREMRQFESSYYDKEKIDLSTRRLKRTQYFEAVDIKTVSVPGISDQVDLTVAVKEKNTGSVKLGAGASSDEGLVGSFSVTQANFLGTGNTVSSTINTSSVNTVYSISHTDPYFTLDGISRRLTAYMRETNTKDLDTGQYDKKSYGLGVGFGIPMNEFDTVNIGFDVDMSDVKLVDSSPQRYKDYCNDVSGGNSSGCKQNEAVLSAGYTSDKRDSALYPRSGYKYNVSSEVTLPLLDMKYYQLNAKVSDFTPLTKELIWNNKINLGYAHSYGDDPYPFFQNYYVGGSSSVRGYKASSIGKQYYDDSQKDFVSTGGTTKIVANTSMLFPLPGGMFKDQVRIETFIDGGGVWEEDADIVLDEMRFSAGLSVLWVSPFGPINVSFAKALNSDDQDETEVFQFGMGTNF
ncbi:outer membrane protein assembly factor BamA [Methylophilaceae bacterium]|nr:outer membrane protein assembly factor BamA [Methylophilaceae bacterium]